VDGFTRSYFFFTLDNLNLAGAGDRKENLFWNSSRAASEVTQPLFKDNFIFYLFGKISTLNTWSNNSLIFP